MTKPAAGEAERGEGEGLRSIGISCDTCQASDVINTMLFCHCVDSQMEGNFFRIFEVWYVVVRDHVRHFDRLMRGLSIKWLCLEWGGIRAQSVYFFLSGSKPNICTYPGRRKERTVDLLR